MHCQQQWSGNKQYARMMQRSLLLQRHPVLTPVLLLSGAGILCIVSFSASNLFPILTLLGIPATLFCLSIAMMLGIVGILVGIISMIEYFSRYSAQATAFSQPKERSYANRH